MKKLSDIKGITPEQIELLEAAGFLEPNSLRTTTIKELHAEIVRANKMLGIAAEAPSSRTVAGWFEQVEADVDVFSPLDTVTDASQQKATVPENKTPQKVPVAILITPQFIKRKQIDVTDLPKAGEAMSTDLVEEVSEKEVFTDETVHEPVILPEKKVEPRLSIESLPKGVSSRERVNIELQKDKVLSMDEFRVKGGKVAPLQRAVEKDITKTTLEETNRGVDPKSRRYIRGVLHKEPGSVFVGSFAILIAQALTFLSVLLLPLIFVDKDKYFWAAFSPLLLLVVLFLWFFIARKAMCPVCRQRQFVPKACLKHNKAHRLPLIGHMASTAIHILGFKWFRCIFCGTSIRLKE